MSFFQWLIYFIFGGSGSSNNTTTTTMTSTTSTIPQETTATTTAISGGEKMKVAICVGINNYPNPANNLKGCVNDANDFTSILKSQYGFNEVRTILDSQATLENITNNITELLSKKPDVFVMTNSSHGTRIPDTTGQENDGYCEAICLYNKFLVDHDFKKILAQADPKTRIVVISDSCHSAGVTRAFLATMNDSSYVSVPKYLPHPDEVEAFKASMSPTTRAVFEPNENMNEVLLSGCRSSEYSYDANFNGRANGAFTYYALQILKENPSITYENFISKLNAYLPSSRYPQNPTCETNSSMRKTAIFS